MPFSFMTLRSLKFVTILSSIAVPALLLAQASSSEEERLQRLMADSAQWYVPKSRVSIGFRVLSDGGKVNFGNLGSVAFNGEVAPLSAGAVDRLYDNGAVRADNLRIEEKDAAGQQITTPGGRYPLITTVEIKDDAGNVIGTENVQTGDLLAYTPGLTRSWGYGSPTQLSADGSHIAMSTYSAVSEGATAFKENGMSAGVEFQYSRIVTNPNKRFQLGVLTGITLNGINSKTVGTVTSTLLTRTDMYSTAGATVPTAPYFAPSFDDYLSDDGEVLRTDGLETTVPISQLPDAHIETTTPGGINVNGSWQVKGAYFMVRLGPTFRTQLSPRFGLNASVGYAGAFAGTTYTVMETFEVPELDGVLVGANAGENFDGIEQTSETKFLSGYYADVNLEWAATERTGLFGGFTAQKFDGYDQMVGSRTARIDLGNSVGLRGGVTIRF
jgi:hypothetical protein